MFKGSKGYYDGKLYYQNSLDSIVDGFLTAAAKQGYSSLPFMSKPHLHSVLSHCYSVSVTMSQSCSLQHLACLRSPVDGVHILGSPLDILLVHRTLLQTELAQRVLSFGVLIVISLLSASLSVSPSLSLSLFFSLSLSPSLPASLPLSVHAVSETGWPTGGDKDASAERASDYYNGLMNHICSGRGTPLRPNTFIKTYIFEAFDEDWKASVAPYEAHFGYRTWDGKSKFSFDRDPAGAASMPLQPPLKWCVVRKGANAATVAGSVAWACSKGGVDCNSYQIKSCGSRGGTAHAVYNALFQQSGQNEAACDFGGTAKITSRNPFNPKRPRCFLPGRPGATS